MRFGAFTDFGERVTGNSYTAEDLWGFLATLPSLPGRGDFLYSNLGFGLLGYILSKRAGISFEELLRRKVFMPTGMNSSTISLSADDWRIRVAPGDSNVLRDQCLRLEADFARMRC